MSMHWTTFRGKSVSLNTIDHQHLSNCYWFSRIVNSVPTGHSHLEKIKAELAERFNGQLLPYRPHVEFEQEIEYLGDHGYLVDITNSPYRVEIWFEGVCVGEIIKPV